MSNLFKRSNIAFSKLRRVKIVDIAGRVVLSNNNEWLFLLKSRPAQQVCF
jgi:hypothetical protein